MKKAIVLLSGGLDSLTVLAYCLANKYQTDTIGFDYGQKHNSELKAAAKIVDHYKHNQYFNTHQNIKIDLTQFGGSALTDDTISVEDANLNYNQIPNTYVPARNIIFLSLALAYSEVNQINNIFIGVNSVDYSGYPDCRPEFIKAFMKMGNLGTKAGVSSPRLKKPVINIETPLINLTKSQIIKLGHNLGVDYSMSVSCYRANSEGDACGKCDACQLRVNGFKEAGLPDPTNYYF